MDRESVFFGGRSENENKNSHICFLIGPKNTKVPIHRYLMWVFALFLSRKAEIMENVT